jgi:DNA end-binding protein Ku
VSRAIWRGSLRLGRHRVPVKLFSAVEDRTVHFRLLHTKDRAPVEQRIVRKDTGEAVPKEDRRKALPVSRERAVILRPGELTELEPPASRDIDLCRFVARDVLSDQWYDRPYYLGPDGNSAAYFALVEALARTESIGIARWVMRKKRYVGALLLQDGYLVMSTLRRADQVLSFSGIEPAKSAKPKADELKLAEQLVSSIAEDFDPTAWHNEYRQRVCALIDAKARGKKLEPAKPKRRAARGDLAANLKASIAAAREKRVA